jgi:hypothetical protein
VRISSRQREKKFTEAIFLIALCSAKTAFLDKEESVGTSVLKMKLSVDAAILLSKRVWKCFLPLLSS